MKPRIAWIDQWDWLRGIVTGAFIFCAVLILLGCSTTRPGCENECDCPDKLTEVKPVWNNLAVEVASFGEARPTGLAITQDGRTFFSFAWEQDKPAFAVIELLPDGSTQPYPSKSWSGWDGEKGASALRSFTSVQAIDADDSGSLWVLDSGNPRNRRGVIPGGPKLVKVDLATDTIVDVIYFDTQKFIPPKAYLSGLCVDTQTQTAYLLDAYDGEVYVVDMAGGVMRRVRLHEPVKRLKSFVQTYKTVAAINEVAEDALSVTGLQESRSTLAGLALSSDGAWLYYHTNGEKLFRVATEKLRDRTLSDNIISASVESLGEVGTRISGISLDDQDKLYMLACDRDSVYVRDPTGRVDTVLADPRLAKVEALASGPDGYLYFSSFKRDAWKVPRGEKAKYTGVVLKFSPQKIARAAQLRSQADDQHAEAGWYSQLAEEAERLAEESAPYLDTGGDMGLAALHDQGAAIDLRARCHEAREAAALAEQLAIEAEFAEVHAPSPAGPGLAEFPTQTD